MAAPSSLHSTPSWGIWLILLKVFSRDSCYYWWNLVGDEASSQGSVKRALGTSIPRSCGQEWPQSLYTQVLMCLKKTSLPCYIMIKLLVCPICTIYKVFSGSFVFKNVLQIILYIRWQNWGIWTDTNPGHDVVMQTVHKMHQLHS